MADLATSTTIIIISTDEEMRTCVRSHIGKGGERKIKGVETSP